MCIFEYIFFFFFFFFKQKTAYEIMPSLVGSEMCIRDRSGSRRCGRATRRHRRRASWPHWVADGRRGVRWQPGSCAWRRCLACEADGPPPGRPRSGRSCQTEVGLDLLPRDRLLAAGHLLPRRARGLDVGEVLSRRDQTVEVVGVDDRRDPLTAAGQVDRFVLDPRGVDHVGETGPRLAHCLLYTSPSPRD